MKGTLGIPVTTTLDKPVVGIMKTRGLMTLVLGETRIEAVKFNDTTSGTCVLYVCVLTCGGDTPLDNIVEVGVYISPNPSPEFTITNPRGHQSQVE